MKDALFWDVAPCEPTFRRNVGSHKIHTAPHFVVIAVNASDLT
jgi:hypothetical protein